MAIWDNPWSTGLMNPISSRTPTSVVDKKAADERARQEAINATQARKNQIAASFLRGRDPSSLTPLEKTELERRVNESYKKETDLPTDGRPKELEFSYLTDLSGGLQDQYKLADWQNVETNKDALNKYGEQALRDPTKASVWGDLMMRQQALNQNTAMDQAGALSAAGKAKALQMMAQTGGVDTGSRERIARGASRDDLLNRQRILRQGEQDRTGIMTQDEQSRLKMLEQYQNMQNQQSDINFKNQQMQQDANRFNLGNIFNEANKKREFDMNMYNQQMQGWAANKQSQAQAQASRGGGKK